MLFCRVCFVFWNNHRCTESCKEGRQPSARVISFPNGSSLCDYNAAVRAPTLCAHLWMLAMPQPPRPAPTIHTEIWSVNTEVTLPASASPRLWQTLVWAHLHSSQSLACSLYSFAFSRMYFKWNQAANNLLKIFSFFLNSAKRLEIQPAAVCIESVSLLLSSDVWYGWAMAYLHSLIWRHFGGFHSLGITNEDAMDIHAQMCGHSSHLSGMNAQDRDLWVLW